jgi:hypothetical protein
MTMALAKIAEVARYGRVRIFCGAGHLTMSVERAQAILRSRRRRRDPTAAALASTIALAIAVRAS